MVSADRRGDRLIPLDVQEPRPRAGRCSTVRLVGFSATED